MEAAAGGQELGLWERVCAEYEAEKPPLPDVPEEKRGSVSLEAKALQLLLTEQFHSDPEAEKIFQQLLSIHDEAPFPEPPNPKTCSPREYVEYYIFPVLIPGIAELLHQAEKKKRTKFIACDFLTEWLYNKNPKRKDESFTEFFSIPFVSDWLKDHPRPPIPLSLLLTEEEASRIIQSFWRGYRVRCDSKIQELRQWQKELRKNKNITERVKVFWTKLEAKVIYTNHKFLRCIKSLEKRLSPVEKAKAPNHPAAEPDWRLLVKEKKRGLAGERKGHELLVETKGDPVISKEVGDTAEHTSYLPQASL